VRPLLVVEGEELVEGFKPPSMFLVGLEEPLDLSVRLRSAHFTERVLNIIAVEKAFELVITIRTVFLMRIDELRAVVGDHLKIGTGLSNSSTALTRSSTA